MAERAAIDRSKLAVSSLTSADSGDLAAFSSGDHDIDDFLKSDALRLERLHVARTYLAWYGSSPELVGYVSLMADAIVLQNRERKKLKLASDDHPVVPAIKIARLGSSVSFRAHHRGVGKALVAFAFVTGLSVEESSGCRLLTLDAYPDSVPFYKKLGFVFNRAADYRDRRNPSMRLDLFSVEEPPWLG